MMRNKSRRWRFVWFVWIFISEASGGDKVINATARIEDSPPPSNEKALRNIFSPRMDYEQWTPLGRGDPLKNDPTYDYVPPVLEKVHYWIDPSLRKPDPGIPGEQPQKTEILVLGVSSKKPSSTNAPVEPKKDSFDGFMKFVDGPKFQQQGSYQRLSRPGGGYRGYYSGYSGFYKSGKEGKTERVPYTILRPPPVPAKYILSSERPAEESVTVQEANLVYHSSTSGGDWGDKKKAEGSSVVTWRTPYKFNNSNSSNNVSFLMTLNSDDAQISGPDVMYKGQVSDGDMDLSSKYVNIGKPEAQIHTAPATALEQDTPIIVQAQSMKKPMTLQLLQLTKNPLTTILTSEATPPSKPVPSSLTSFMANIPKASTKIYTTTPPTTTTNSLTTDPLFKHYKQPSEPLRGPMYLIIQGHSKVKTYGPAKQIHGINIQEFNEIPDYYNNKDPSFQVKHLHVQYRKKSDDSARRGRSNKFENLSEVVKNSFGAIQYADETQEAELVAGFDVAAEERAQSEVYRKGTVEDEMGRKLKEA